MPAATETKSVLIQIASGECDDILDDVFSALRDRERVLRAIRASQSLSQLSIGDEVRLNGNASPKYLVGTPGKVVRINSTRVVIKLLRGVRQYPEGLEVPCPPDILDKIDASEADVASGDGATPTPAGASPSSVLPAAPSFAPGDEVVFNSQASPRYLIGAKAIVVRLLPRNLVISLQETRGRFAAGEMRCPPELLDKVEQNSE